MKKLKIALYVVGVLQIVLGIMALFFPTFFAQTVMELSPVHSDIGYPFGMLASRLLVFGVLMFIIARCPEKNVLLINAMIAIQAIDLLAGIFYVSTGEVALSSAAAALFNATWIMVLLSLWKPKCTISCEKKQCRSTL